jgi:hypothetical protein
VVLVHNLLECPVYLTVWAVTLVHECYGMVPPTSEYYITWKPLLSTVATVASDVDFALLVPSGLWWSLALSQVVQCPLKVCRCRDNVVWDGCSESWVDLGVWWNFHNSPTHGYFLSFIRKFKSYYIVLYSVSFGIASHLTVIFKFHNLTIFFNYNIFLVNFAYIKERNIVGR